MADAGEEKSLSYRFFHYELNGVPVYLFIGLAVPVILGIYTQSLTKDMLSTLAILFVLGMIFMEVGKRLPIWNNWFGGGSMMAIMFPSFMVFMKWLPQKYVESITTFYDGIGFLQLYVGLLMVGGLLSVDKDILLKTLARCGPVFLGTILCAGLFGMIGGSLMGMDLGKIFSYYVLPNLGGGNGAGAVPMSEIFQRVTGISKDKYYPVALAILTLGSTIALILGVILSRLGKTFPNLASDGTQLLRHLGKEGDKVQEASEKAKSKAEVKPSPTDIAAGFVITGGFYALACFVGGYLLPDIGGVIIHPYAYLVVFLTIAKILGIIPEHFCAGVRYLSKFVTEKMGPMCFAGMGIAITDFGEFVNALTPQTFFVTFMIIIGVALGAGLLGQLVGFYPIDSSIIVGLCCANRGGSADVVLLSATDRLELMPYAVVLSRIGGAIVLALSSAIFAVYF
ncbi:Citrate:sodium symporter [Ruminococcaceae bacterium BL-6]|nr:Citrate:sodium symporter [Ruminococcaceae bacterium BL-6]